MSLCYYSISDSAGVLGFWSGFPSFWSTFSPFVPLLCEMFRQFFSGVWFIRSLHGLPTYRVNCGVVIKLKNHLISPWAWPKAGCLSSNVYLKKDLCVSLQNPARVGCRMITDWPTAEPANHMWWHYLEGSVSQTLNTNTEILRWKKYISTFLQQVFRAEMTVLLVGWVLCCQWSSSCHWIFELWD